MPVAVPSAPRPRVDGKFFRIGQRKFHIKGVAYGPFAPDAAGLPFASPEATRRDFQIIREQLGANLVRIYHVPPRWILDLADEFHLKLLIDIPWSQHLCFLDDKNSCAEALDKVRTAVSACGGHPAILAFSVANEFPPDIVRWSGAAAVSAFIDELISAAKSVDPECLCTFANYPSTEFLNPSLVDFYCFNVYLHQEPAFRAYLAKLQMLSDGKPLLLGECGADSIREGEQRKSSMLAWQIEDAFRAGLAGSVVFTFTDDWYREGRNVTDWQMGITTVDRQPKLSFQTVQRAFAVAPYFPLDRNPKVSVVVASYNGARTLNACLESLRALNYPDYEVILVDDGSTDNTPEIAGKHPAVRCLRHPRNLGLSAARNTGIAAAAGEIVAFTDADCRVDEDWLYYLVSTLTSGDYAAVGGPNLLPPEDSAVAAAVMASPGGPAHVMLTDTQAEHIPGCNMAFYRWALIDLGGFDPLFERAGDDVDVCWRLQQAGCKIGFSPAAFVWHFRRSTVRDYLKQQRGYGDAEALLVRKHPEYFNSLGGSIWRGRIYSSGHFGVVLRSAIIYRGLFGSAGYQSLYAPQPVLSLMLCTTLEYHAFVTLPLWVLSALFRPLLPLAIASFLLSVGISVLAGIQASIPKEKKRWWSRPLVAFLFFVQPIVRGWARYQGRANWRPQPLAAKPNLDSVALRDSKRSLERVAYWSEKRINRLELVRDIITRLDQQGWPNRVDVGWSDYDLEVFDTRWARVQLTTAAESHPKGKQIIRVRLRALWSLRATTLFWLVAGLQGVLLGLVGRTYPWLALILLSLPLFAWALYREKRGLQSMLMISLDGIAKDWNLTKIEAPGREVTAFGPEPMAVLSSRSPFAAPAPSPAPPPINAEAAAVPPVYAGHSAGPANTRR